MKYIALAVSLALGTSSLSYAHSSSENKTSNLNANNRQSMKVVKSTDNPDKPTSQTVEFDYDAQLSDGDYIYIVHFDLPSIAENPLTSKALKSKSISASEKNVVASYKAQLDLQHSNLLSAIESTIGKKDLLHSYKHALNGVAIKMSQNEALKLTELSGIKSIVKDKIYTLHTDRGPTLIGAPNLWQGQVANIEASQGEGVVVGIVDSGINTDHPSFAETSDDGYTHTNPLGSGNYLGDCAGNFPELCNSKLIGVYSYPSITDEYSDTEVFPANLARNGEDYDGHGSHVAATAAGNLLLNVQETLPESGAVESDGVASEFTFAQLSGVAPRANIISYQVCFPGSAADGDTYSGCPGSAISAGIDSAIADRVDVINFSISGGGDPWDSSTELAFLNAQNLGIYVATSAGNSGPNPSSSEKNAPWYTSVAASEHGRENAYVKEINDYSGGGNPPPVITGQSNSGSIRASIVYAGDFANPNDPNNDSAQCLQAFPSNTFSGQIVVCDRGEIARVEKAENVASGGAGGFVLANVDGGVTFLANDEYVIPGIHIKADEGNQLKQWLASGANHMATITEAETTQFIDEDRVDVVAGFSSRGPNLENSTLTPSMTAPGVEIYAAYADQQFGHDGHTPAAGDFNYLQGTSMASPHVAGAAALLKSIKSDWSPDEIRSALSMTATTTIRLDDEETEADFFDVGAGRINVDLAAQSGLIMNETFENYIAADPDEGGEPRSLNLPSITDNNCLGICSWSRTFKATKDGSWTVSTESFDDDLIITASPSNFDIQEGQTQTITVNIDSLSATKSEYIFGKLNLTAANSPSLSLPISVLSSLGDVPKEVEHTASRNKDQILIEDIESISIDNFLVSPFSLVKATVLEDTVGQDSENDEYLDDLNDGVVATEITVPENAKRVVAEIVSSSATDLDLFLIYDANDDGFLSSSEEIAKSISSNQFEEVAVNFPEPGRYFIVVQSFTASSPSAQDDFELRYAVVNGDDDGSLTTDAPSSIDENTPFDIGIVYDLDDPKVGDSYYGAIGLSNEESRPDKLGMIDLNITVGEFDTRIIGEPVRLDVNQQASLEVIVAANTTDLDRRYRISVPLPENTEFTQFTAANEGQIIGNSLVWVVEKLANDNEETVLDFDILVLPEREPGAIELSLESELLDRSYTSVFTPPAFTKLQLEGAPVIQISGTADNTFEVEETRTIVIPISVSDPNDDNISVVWTQTSAGAQATITQENGVTSITAPNVSSDSELTFEVTATDDFENSSTSTVILKVTNNEAPTITNVTAPTSGNGGQQITISFTATDPENDSLTYSIGGITGSSRNITLPRTGSSISYQLSVSDGINTVTQTVTISLTQAPVRPRSSGGGGSTGLILLSFAALIGLTRRFKKVGVAE